MKMRDLDIKDYEYDLPRDRIALYPVSKRDGSQLLVYQNDKISKDIFKNIDEYIPAGSLLVFNNTRVIRARLLFTKETGASIEILCLEPFSPAEYALSFGSTGSVQWKCIVGNLKKWKHGVLVMPFISDGITCNLSAEKVKPVGEAWIIRFSWDCRDISFGKLLELTGHIPLPPYIGREDTEEDYDRYQTVYSRIEGSVAAPTAGLHFTGHVLEKLKSRGIRSLEVTLHVGAGTFQPVKSEHIYAHEMHAEHFSVDRRTIELLGENEGKIVAVGTTSVRTLESLYWSGVKLIGKPAGRIEPLTLRQWEPYEMDDSVPVADAMKALLIYFDKHDAKNFQATTSIMIVPGYRFRMINGMITNFHQPRSSLLLLISAWTGDRWKNIYTFAIRNGFRFLSYGDSSLLLK